MVVLAVIFPEADRADLVAASLRQGDEATARACVGASIRSALDVHKLLHANHSRPSLSPVTESRERGYLTGIEPALSAWEVTAGAR